MTVKTLFATVTGFIAHYADEAAAAGKALDMILSSLPIQAQDKAAIQEYIDTISAAPAKINAALNNIQEPAAPTVKIDKADISAAVGGWLASKDGKAAINTLVVAEVDKVVKALPAPVSTEPPSGEA